MLGNHTKHDGKAVIGLNRTQTHQLHEETFHSPRSQCAERQQEYQTSSANLADRARARVTTFDKNTVNTRFHQQIMLKANEAYLALIKLFA